MVSWLPVVKPSHSLTLSALKEMKNVVRLEGLFYLPGTSSEPWLLQEVHHFLVLEAIERFCLRAGVCVVASELKLCL